MNQPNREKGIILAIPLVEEFEGFRTHAYQDSVGVWTIGFGNTHYLDGRHVGPGEVITREEAEQLLTATLIRFADHLDKLVKVRLTEHEYAALLSFIYNLGPGALQASTLLKKLNRGDHQGAANEILRWNKAGGHVLAGLVRRRAAEKQEFTA